LPKSVRKTVRIANQLGLHARPAMLFAEEAARFSSTVQVCRTDDPSVCADGKSVMQLLILAATHKTQLSISAEGDDAEEAADALIALVNEKFREE